MKFCLTVSTMPLQAISRRPPDLLIWFDGLSQQELILREQLKSKGEHGGALLVVYHHDQMSTTNRRKISLGELTELTQLLKETGIPRRSPKLDEQMDSKDETVQIYLAGEIDTQPFSVELHLMSSSYTGQDARAFAAFCRYLLWLSQIRRKAGSAGVLDEKLWSTLTGPLEKQ